MTKGLASILVPVFNGSKYILEFLNSVQAQTYRPIQLLISDDCSKDASFFICEEWADNNADPALEIRCFQNRKNVGLSHNLSELASKADGEFIFIADQDDVWKETKVEHQIKYMREHADCMINLCDRSITNEQLDIIVESNYRNEGFRISVMDFAEVIKHRSIYAANTMAIRNIGANIFNIPSKVVQHDTFIAVMASRYGTIDYSFEPLLLYRIHGDNLSGNFCIEFSKNVLQCFMRCYKVAKRGAESAKNDGLILEEELYQRFNIKLTDYKNAFLCNRTIHPFRYAWKRTLKSYQAGKIGIWIKRNK